MAVERFWERQGPISLTTNGGQDGLITVSDISGLKVKQHVVLSSDTQPDLKLQIKRIHSLTSLTVGPIRDRTYPAKPKDNLKSKADISAYLVSDNATIRAAEQPKAVPTPEDIIRAVYDQEPALAIRTIDVDRAGNPWGTNNPFPVQLSDGSINIGTVNGELEVQLTHLDNDPDAGDVHDSVRIGDGVEELLINPDGSINVSQVLSNTSVKIESTYNEITAIPTDTTTTLVSYTAPIGKISFLHRIFVSGNNIAQYTVKLNGNIIDKCKTYLGSSLNTIFDFSDGTRGKPLQVGDIVLIEVEHSRSFLGEFNGRIQSIEIT